MASDRADKTSPEVFISVGRYCSPEQQRVVGHIFDYVRKSGLRPISERHGDYWPTTGAVDALREVMERSAGTIVIAFERKQINVGKELRRDEIRDELLTTVWNQVEAGMACLAHHPILVVIDNAVRQEGLLDRNFPWRVEPIELAKFDPHSELFAQLFTDFRDQVIRFQGTRKKRSMLNFGDDTPVREILGAFSLKQLVTIGSVILSMIWAAYQFGRYHAH